MHRNINPQDSVDLILNLESFGETLGTLYPQAIVYDANNNQITGSPFNLILLGNDVYILRNAFQADVDSGTYLVKYIIYTDSGHTTRSSAHGEQLETITVKIQSTTGLGGYGSMKNAGGDVIVDFDPVVKLIKDTKESLEKKIGKIQKEVDDGFKIDIPEIKNGLTKTDIKDLEIMISSIPRIKEGKDIVLIKNLIEVLQKSSKNGQIKIIDAIKKNRSTTMKSKFDKRMLSPEIETNANIGIKIDNVILDIKKNITNTIDMNNSKIKSDIKGILTTEQKNIISAMNELNEQIRVKLKFTLDGLKMLVLGGKQPKQNINITLKKDEL